MLAGKGLFTKEIDAALLAGAIDACLTALQSPPICRARTCVTLLSARILRGNVETRLSKAEASEVGATLLAVAGLKQLGLAHRARAILDVDTFLPAPGQDAIAITARSVDARTFQTWTAISDSETMTALATERAFVAEFEGSCRTPIAGLAPSTPGGAASSRPSQSKGIQGNPRKRAWISLDSFGRIGTFQGVRTNPSRKLLFLPFPKSALARQGRFTSKPPP
jgi:hydroxymethylbilane synthase